MKIKKKMKNFYTDVIIDASIEELASFDITDPSLKGAVLVGWDFNIMTQYGPSVKAYMYYNEDKYYLIPMKYIRFFDLSIERARLIYPDTLESSITIVSWIGLDRHFEEIQRKLTPYTWSKVFYHEIEGSELKVMVSPQAYKINLVGELIEKIQELGFNPVCDEEGINIEYEFEKANHKSLIKLFNKYIGFWKSIAIRTNHDKENKIARYFIKYSLITGEDLTDNQLMSVVDHIQQLI